MRKDISFHLDWLRACAASAVFIGHFAYIGTNFFTSNQVWAAQRVGVIFFFVLSGYIIRSITKERSPSLQKYTEDRLARILSVYLPALALTLICDVLGRSLDNSLYVRYPSPGSAKFLLGIPLFLTFMFENSFFSMRWLSNGPAWSIAYEFWYYVIFGIVFLYKGKRKTTILVVALFLAGWKVLLLFPIWAFGAFLADTAARVKNGSKKIPILLITLGVTLVAAYCSAAGQTILHPLNTMGSTALPLGLHSYFLSDYILTIPIAAIIFGITTLPEHEIPPRIKKVATTWAGFSFSLYLFHLPIIALLRSTHIYNPESAAQSISAAALVFFLCHLISTRTERNKAAWRVALHDSFEKTLISFRRNRNGN